MTAKHTAVVVPGPVFLLGDRDREMTHTWMMVTIKGSKAVRLLFVQIPQKSDTKKAYGCWKDPSDEPWVFSSNTFQGCFFPLLWFHGTSMTITAECWHKTLHGLPNTFWHQKYSGPPKGEDEQNMSTSCMVPQGQRGGAAGMSDLLCAELRSTGTS
jgi:hypothetical protein